MNNPTITKKQQELLYLIYRYRFLTTSLIQQFFNHKDPHRIKEWLKDLVNKQYIHRIDPNLSFRDKTKPTIYCLATKARQILKEKKECEITLLNRLYREKDLSAPFQAHCLFLASLSLQLSNYYQEKGQTLRFFTKVALYGYTSFPRPLPDAYFSVKKENHKKRRYFLDVFDADTKRFELRKRIAQYIAYISEGTWDAQTSEPFPSILLILPHLSMQQYANRFIAKTLEDEQIDVSFYLTNTESITAQGLQKVIWQKVAERA